MTTWMHRNADTHAFTSDVVETTSGAASLWDALNLDGPASWTASALCAQTDPEVFYPEKGESTLPAKRVCARCPVRSECLEEALSRNERYGVWGGLSERERRALLRSSAGAGVELADDDPAGGEDKEAA